MLDKFHTQQNMHAVRANLSYHLHIKTIVLLPDVKINIRIKINHKCNLSNDCFMWYLVLARYYLKPNCTCFMCCKNLLLRH